MKSKIITYLMLLGLSTYYLFGNSNNLAAAQSSNNLPNEVNFFGSSLKKAAKKKKDSTKSAQQNKSNTNEINSTNDDVIRVDTIMVANEVSVFDENGNHVKGLKKEDFIVREDNQPQEISTFLSGDSELIPRSIVLIIDYSGSQLPYIETSIKAAQILVDKLNSNDRMAIVTDNVELFQNFTADKSLLKDKLESLKNAALSGKVGTSKQYSALMATLKEMFNDDAVRPIIIFQTDGDQLSQRREDIKETTFHNFGEVSFSYQDILTMIEKTRTTIYTIIPGIRFSDIPKAEKVKRAKMDLENIEKSMKILNVIYKPTLVKMPDHLLESRAEFLKYQQDAITKIAKVSGGLTNYLERPEQAEQVYSDILSNINQRYVIGYYPPNQSRDGKVRKITTEVRGHPNYKILGRKTFILAKDKL